MMNEFYISDVPNKALFFGSSGAILLIPILLIVGFFILWNNISSAKLVMTDATLNINAAFYGRVVAFKDISTDKVRQLDFSQDKALRISYRTNGIGLFSLSWGWFKLKNSRKALIFMTDPGKAVYIPTTLGYDLIVSVKEPQALVKSLKELSR